MALPEVHIHSSAALDLLRLLQPCLPHSQPLYRRLQNPLRSDGSTVLSTLPPSASTEEARTRCWAAAFTDRYQRPQTEMFVFLSSELPSHTNSNTNDKHCTACVSALQSLLKHLPSLSRDPAEASTTPANLPKTKYAQHAAHPQVLLAGGVSPLVRDACVRLDVPWHAFSGTDPSDGNVKFLFQLDGPRLESVAASPLPEGLAWTALDDAALDTVQARTPIPRPRAALARMFCIGVRDVAEDEVVAWAFLGVDGSLTSLHVEEAWRGKGVAKSVAARCMREGMETFGPERIGHADVHVENAVSQGMCKSLGGEQITESFWVRVDLERCKEL